jgi:hypothetical protein
VASGNAGAQQIDAITAVLDDPQQRELVSATLRDAGRDWEHALAVLQEHLPEPTMARIRLANTLAEWSNDNVAFVGALTRNPDVTDIRDIASRYNVADLAAALSAAPAQDDGEAAPTGNPADAKRDTIRATAVQLRQRLYTAAPTAVVQRMVADAEVPVADPAIRCGVTSFFAGQPDFDMRTTSVYTAFQHPKAFTGIDRDAWAGVTHTLKVLQRVQAISPVPEAIPALMESGLTSAVAVAQIPETTFRRKFSSTLGEPVTAQVHANAINVQIRNETALAAMRDIVRGSGMAIVDGPSTRQDRAAAFAEAAGNTKTPVNLEDLFGIDTCECDDCLSIYSPAAYFVDLLQYLRNNDLDPNAKSDPTDITGTPLDMLFRRRPDLKCLELTCDNTFTVLPYIDLATEVMESFTVHAGDYSASTTTPKQATLEVFNVTDETTTELLSQPQHVNYQAYCFLKGAVYPFTLPYHQPIDVARIWLPALGTTRYELLDTFRTPTETNTSSTTPLPQAEQDELNGLHREVYERATDSEYLGITQEEYIILTHEAFWAKRYFEITTDTSISADDYHTRIGVQATHAYYGYDDNAGDAAMLDTDENGNHTGLTFVKEQFLPRTGVHYADLVDILRTRYVNPMMPAGHALTVMDAIAASYRYLQTLLVPDTTDPATRFAKIIDWLTTSIPQIEATLNPDPCHTQNPCNCEASCGCGPTEDFLGWLECYFDRIGKLIVLDSGDIQFPVTGFIWPHGTIGEIRSDGTIVDQGVTVGTIDSDGVIQGDIRQPLSTYLDILHGRVPIRTGGFVEIGYVARDFRIYNLSDQVVSWSYRDLCDLDRVRLTHLDGSALTVEEYDRIQRFIRLWRKLGWTVGDTDRALIALSSPAGTTGVGSGNGFVDLGTFTDSCSDGDAVVTPCPDIAPPLPDIAPATIHQLAALGHVLEITGLDLDDALALWGDIGTSGDSSLYARLFLTHNILAVDKVFASDANGNYLTGTDKLSDHLPAVMAALKLKAPDVAAIIADRALPDTLTVGVLSWLYRYTLIARVLSVRVTETPAIIAVFGDPFTSPQTTTEFLQTWQSAVATGFTYRQLHYIIGNVDDPLRPIAPSPRAILQLAKTLYDGLTAITTAHPDPDKANADTFTDDTVRSGTSLLFSSDAVDAIVGLLDGSSVYTTNAPTGLKLTIPEQLTGRLTYIDHPTATPPTATMSITGILSDTDMQTAKSLTADPKWSQALDRAAKQPTHLLDTLLRPVVAAGSPTEHTLLEGDFNPAPTPTNPAPDGTASEKRLAFLTAFAPYLRAQLAHKLIVDTCSATVGLTGEITDLLLSHVLEVPTTGQTAIDVLHGISDTPSGGPGWSGYLAPAASADYTFIAIGSDTQPGPIVIDGATVAFAHQQDDPNDVWFTDAVTLDATTLHTLDTGGLPIIQLQWKTATSLPVAIPSSALMPDHTTSATGPVLIALTKAAILVTNLNLSATEIAYLAAHGADFDMLNFNAITLPAWKRLAHFTTLRDGLSGASTSLIDLFGWAAATTPAPDPTKLAVRIAAATGWNVDTITALISDTHFALNTVEAYRNEIPLLTLQPAITIVSASTVSVDRLFAWANPASAFDTTHAVAADIQAALRARYTQDDWEQVVKPLYDQLRADQRDALIAYLCVQPALREWGVIDADSLFEFFLLDVQMGACMETSRIKQAISSVQSFIQRCLLGLESGRGVPVDVLDRGRWEKWMQKYRVWEANRQVFCYPENWLKADLRDDVSPPFTELQSTLLQNDLTATTLTDAIHTYVSGFDTIANLQPVGLYIEEATVDHEQKPSKLHIFARTRNAPHLFFYRHFDYTEPGNATAGQWTPWESVNVDIGSYDVETANGTTVETPLGGNGSYIIPYVFNDRLLIFFPEFRRKTIPKPTAAGNYEELGKKQVSDQQPSLHWEIAMAYSEFRNGKWLPKQVSTDTVTTFWPNPNPAVPPDISQFRFTPSLSPGTATTPDTIVIDCFDPTNSPVGAFEFTGSHLVRGPRDVLNFVDLLDFHYRTTTTSPQLHSQQGTLPSGHEPYAAADQRPYITNTPTNVTIEADDGTSIEGTDNLAHQLLGALARDGLDGIFNFYREQNTAGPVSDIYGAVLATTGVTFNELARPYSLYHWEIGFHAITLFVDRLLASGQFDLALQMMHYVLNPFAAGTSDDPVWRFAPFAFTDARNDLEALFTGLQAGQPNPAVTAWRDDPFQPHVVARSRIGAYMRWAAMTYIQIWIGYGDYYFRQNTLETLPLAIQCYVVASHLYGPRAETIPKRGKTVPQTYSSLLDKWDAFSNAMVELELVFPFSNQITTPQGNSNGVVGLPNIFGFATSLYFCIPDNPNLTALRDTIDDRLFKIRHCQDIDGNAEHLPLFEPPIDPALLVEAAAQGLSLSTVLSDLNAPTPNYRFTYLLSKAMELCAELKTLGNALISAREKHDAEALAQLRASHETAINSLVMEVRTRQADEADKALDALQQSRKSPVYRLNYNLTLIEGDTSKIPGDPSTEFTEIPDVIEKRAAGSPLQVSETESLEATKASDANDSQTLINKVEALASIFHALPTIEPHATPIGVGVAINWGGANLGNATQAVARKMQIDATNLSFDSSDAGRQARFHQQYAERVHAANVAGYEITSIDKQILTQQIRQAIAAQEITNQQKMIDNAQAVEDYLRNKYSNTELYSYLDTQTRGLYYQTYTMAYDLAKKAEQLYRFERGLTSTNFINFGYWDPAYDGLLAGENLYNSLKKLEASYQEKRCHDFEIVKPVSLRQIDPLALLNLRATGQCDFELPEVLFDMDYPGHYQRRLKTVAVTIPAVVGPYTSVNATLRLVSHAYRNTALQTTSKTDYPRTTDSDDTRFTTMNIPITAIAVSTGQNDAGVFELNFRDERYLPFEGAGAISTWHLELPTAFRQFDYDTITDVVLQLRYTTLDGGAKLGQIASSYVQDVIKHVENLSRTEGLFAAFDLQHDFPDEWYHAVHSNPRVLTLTDLAGRLPIFTRASGPGKIQATDIYVFTPATPTPTVTVIQGGNPITLTAGALPGSTLPVFSATDLNDIPIDAWQLQLDGDNLTLDPLWLVVRYTFTQTAN